MKNDNEKVLRAPADMDVGGDMHHSQNIPIITQDMINTGNIPVDYDYSGKEAVQIISQVCKALAKEKEERKKHEKKITKEQERHVSNTDRVIGAFRDFVGKEVSDAKQELSDKFDAKIDRLDAKIDRLDAKIDSNTLRLQEEFKSTKRWMIGTLIGVSSLLVALLSYSSGALTKLLGG